MNSINYINNLSEDEFCNIFGNVFEKTAWIAKKTYELKPFINLENFRDNFLSIYDQSSVDQLIIIFNSHPQLAVEKIMTKYSIKEQSQSNLDSCTKDELDEFIHLNKKYIKKFNFPFIIAVAGFNKKEILVKFRKRINNSYNEEFEEAARLIDRITKITKPLEKQRIAQIGSVDQDVMGLARMGLAADLQLLFVRGGQLIGRKDFYWDDAKEASDQ